MYTVIMQDNYFWYVGIIITPKLGYLAPVNLLFGMLSCNEQWKTLLFFYCLGDIVLLPFPTPSRFYNILALGGLLHQNYYTLPFKNIQQNILFFPCLCIPWSLSTILFLNTRFELGPNNLHYTISILLPIILFTSHYSIQKQTYRILNSSIEELTHPFHIIHFVENIEKKLKDPISYTGIEKWHRMECRDGECLCCKGKTAGDLEFGRLYLRQL